MADQAEWVKRPRTEADDARCSAQDYEALYARSIEDADGFWADQAERLDWIDKPTAVADWSFDPVDIRWFSDGSLNICHNAVDRHVENGHGDAVALIFETLPCHTVSALKCFSVVINDGLHRFQLFFTGAGL